VFAFICNSDIQNASSESLPPNTTQQTLSQEHVVESSLHTNSTPSTNADENIFEGIDVDRNYDDAYMKKLFGPVNSSSPVTVILLHMMVMQLAKVYKLNQTCVEAIVMLLNFVLGETSNFAKNMYEFKKVRFCKQIQH